MKRSSSIFFLYASCLVGALALAGCSGMTSSFPDTPAENPMPAIHGSALGGHSPIIGGEVYVFQTGTSYGTAPSSVSINKLTDGAVGTDPTNGAYVLTSVGGTFSITGDYTCTKGQPVYLDVVGGSTTVGAYLIPITASAYTGGTVTFTGANTLPASGGQVSFASGAFTHDSGYSGLNGTTVSVTGRPTATKFKITFHPTNTRTSVKGDALAGGLPNPAINIFAVLGTCNTPAAFAAEFPFVYISEESTVAAAYALGGFGNGPFNIGAPHSNLAGIVNAANTAGQLYNFVKGGTAVSNTNAGLNGTTSNGVVPETKLNTLANILASCVDSGSTASSPSSICTTLFSNATNNGVANGGTVPTDTATAAFNIAQYPASNVAALYPLQNAGTSPFAPNLNSAPSDFTVTIAYTGGGLGATNGKSPHSVAVDAKGNVYTVNYASSRLNVFSGLGVPQNATGYNGEDISHPVSVAVDSDSATVWIANSTSNYMSSFNVNGTGNTAVDFGGPAGAHSLRDAEFDPGGSFANGGTLWVTDSKTSTLYEIEFQGFYPFGRYGVATGPTTFSTPYGVAIDPADDIWVANESTQEATECSFAPRPPYTFSCSNLTSGSINYPVGAAIDKNSNAWFGNSSGTISAFTTDGGVVAGSPFATGAANLIDGIAIDGADSVWATNTAGNALYEFSNTGAGPTVTRISPASGYSADAPDGIAIDGSGNVWYDTTSSGTLYEVVGAATPVVTPISLGVLNGTLGTEP
jgi:sugar lactone lactonase YvrE